MKRLLVLTAAALPLLTVGCDEQAQKFARETGAILDNRSVQISRKIAAEEKGYEAFADHSAQAHFEIVQSSLQNERNERVDDLTAAYLEDHKLVSRWRKNLRDYAGFDYEQNADLLTSDLTASTAFLERFEALKVEQDKVAALSKLLATLAEKPNLKSGIDDLVKFAVDTKSDFDQKVCNKLASQKTGTDDAAKAAAKLYEQKGCKADPASATGG